MLGRTGLPVPPEHRQDVEQTLLQAIADASNHITTGFIGNKYAWSALTAIGRVDPSGYAATLAFESFLASLAAACWQPQHVSRLSVDFLVAFGCELTPRLDVNHRIRSTELAAADKAKLRAPPFAAFADQAALAAFQS